jgi:hypothetical protein
MKKRTHAKGDPKHFVPERDKVKLEAVVDEAGPQSVVIDLFEALKTRLQKAEREDASEASRFRDLVKSFDDDEIALLERAVSSEMDRRDAQIRAAGAPSFRRHARLHGYDTELLQGRALLRTAIAAIGDPIDEESCDLKTTLEVADQAFAKIEFT